MKTKKNAFTLIELLVTLSLFVIIASLVAPHFFSSLTKGKDDNAVKLAAMLDMAKASFRADVGDIYATNAWASAGSDEARYDLLNNGNYLSASAENLGGGITNNGYAPKGYRFFLNALTNRTSVFRTTGATNVGNRLVDKE